MRKFIFLSLILAILIFSGCSTQLDQASQDSNVASDSQVKLTQDSTLSDIESNLVDETDDIVIGEMI
jgi:PBP1b-binding outer membrane lipoprotein LpoB